MSSSGFVYHTLTHTTSHPHTVTRPQSMVSGGVDSAVCTALLNAALGKDKVVAVHIDNGFMRKNESLRVKESLEALGIEPHGRNLSTL